MIELADQILEVLQGDNSFQNFLGEYWFKDEAGGSAREADAICILAANEQLPSLDRIVGVECVIMRTPEMNSRPLIAGCPVMEKTWRLYLVEYLGADPNDIVHAADRICVLFPGATYSVTYTHQGSLDLAGKQQIVVKLPPHVMVPEDPDGIDGCNAYDKDPHHADYGFTYEPVTCADDYGYTDEYAGQSDDYGAAENVDIAGDNDYGFTYQGVIESDDYGSTATEASDAEDTGGV